MQDIDFDEIDRAVNSVTSASNAASTPVVDTPATPVIQSVSTPVAVSTPNQAISAHVAPSLAARRSSGRFMDVVHPSSDMRPQAPAAATFHREDVAPRPTEVPERPVFAPEPVVESTPEPTPEPVESPTSSAFHWPDPIDLNNLDDTSATKPFVSPVISAPEPAVEPTPSPVVEAVATPAPAVEAKPVVNLDDELQSSLESPFLSNTKVEKRPLGAFSFPESDLPLLDDFTNEPSNSEKTTDTDASAPTELDEDILLLEADNEDEFEKVEDAEVAELPEITAPVDEPFVAPEPTPAPAPIDDAPVGPTSITQQYKEHPSTDDQASGAIYDTATYHQPLAHPAKKGSSLLIIAWIVGLIIVGGGIGAAVYFFVLPLL